MATLVRLPIPLSIPAFIMRNRTFIYDTIIVYSLEGSLSLSDRACKVAVADFSAHRRDRRQARCLSLGFTVPTSGALIFRSFPESVSVSGFWRGSYHGLLLVAT